MRLHAALDAEGAPSERVFQLAYLNASYEAGFQNPIDAAIRDHAAHNAPATPDLSVYERLGEVPYDFVRKRLTILVAQGERRFMITKGTLANVLAVCTKVETAAARRPRPVSLGPDGWRRAIWRQSGPAFKSGMPLSARKGYRVLGVAYRDLPSATEMLARG